MRNKLFPYFNDFIIIFGKDRTTREEVEIVFDAIEQDNDDEDEFVDANDNYHEEPQDEREEENREDIVASTCDTIVATSKRIQTNKKKAKSSSGTSDLVEQLVNFQKVFQEAT